MELLNLQSFDWKLKEIEENEIAIINDSGMKCLYYAKPENHECSLYKSITLEEGKHCLRGKIKCVTEAALREDEFVIELYGLRRGEENHEVYYKRLEVIAFNEILDFNITDLTILAGLEYYVKLTLKGKMMKVFIYSLSLEKEENDVRFYVENGKYRTFYGKKKSEYLTLPKVTEYKKGETEEFIAGRTHRHFAKEWYIENNGITEKLVNFENNKNAENYLYKNDLIVSQPYNYGRLPVFLQGSKTGLEFLLKGETKEIYIKDGRYDFYIESISEPFEEGLFQIQKSGDMLIISLSEKDDEMSEMSGDITGFISVKIYADKGYKTLEGICQIRIEYRSKSTGGQE